MAICVLFLAGCAGDIVDGVKQAEESNAVDDERAALEAELAETKEELEKTRKELSEMKEELEKEKRKSDSAENISKESEFIKDSEGSDATSAGTMSEAEAKQAEYLQNLQKELNSNSIVGINNRYKFTYYADDINRDGFPEVLVFGDKNTGRGYEQELFYTLLYRQERGNQQLVISGRAGSTGTFYSDTERLPESGVLEFSYTADGSNIVCHYCASKSCTSGDSSKTIFSGAAYVISDQVCL